MKILTEPIFSGNFLLLVSFGFGDKCVTITHKYVIIAHKYVTITHKYVTITHKYVTIS